MIAAKIPRLILLLALLFGGQATAETLTVLTQNLDRLFDDIDDGNREKVLSTKSFRKRIRGAATKFAETYGLPQIIALQEVENLNVVKKIAAEIRRRYRVDYRPLLLAGHDPSGINLAYLVSQDLDIKKVEQLFYSDTIGAEQHHLFSRPPLYLETCYLEKCLAILNLHLRSMRGIDSLANGERVRRKRLAQAQAIAAWSDRQQNKKSAVSLLILGDLNALTPPDKYVDVSGIIRGNPDNRQTRLRGPDLVEPDLVDLTESISPQQRYSFIFRRRKQQLDYMLVNRDFAASVENIEFGRIDRRFSDHAGLLARFSW